MIELPPKSARVGNFGMNWARLGMVKKYFGARVGAIMVAMLKLIGSTIRL
jgi:hypothetical protein